MTLVCFYEKLVVVVTCSRGRAEEERTVRTDGHPELAPTSEHDTLRQWGTQVTLEIPAEIPFAHELSMKIFQENAQIKKPTGETYF